MCVSVCVSVHALAGNIPREWSEDACGEAVSGVRERQRAGGAFPGVSTRYQQRTQTLPATGVSSNIKPSAFPRTHKE